MLATAVLLAAPSPAMGLLTPGEVLVVANANAKGSEELANYYVVARVILPERLVALKVTAEPTITRADYNTGIRDPLRNYLRQKDPDGKIKCIVLIWGVPLRVLGTELTPLQQELHKSCKMFAERMEGRLVGDLELLKTVGTAFPTPRGDPNPDSSGLGTPPALSPPARLFDLKSTPVQAKPPDYGPTLSTFEKELAEREKTVGELKDPAQRQIAQRQLAALRLDVYGLAGLEKHLPAETIEGVPARDELRRQIDRLGNDLTELAKVNKTPASLARLVEAKLKLDGLTGVVGHCRAGMNAIDTAEEEASVDSELALLWEGDEALRGMRPNPAFWRLAQMTTQPKPRRMIMTARIDGPTPRDALRIIKDGLAAEKTGLKGVFYVDAGGKYPKYDENLHQLVKFLQERTRQPVVEDTKPEVLPPGSAADAALYVGWYSLQKYVPAFTWVPGAVGWHIASFEAVHLRDAGSQEWCVKMIQNGVAATIGAVSEPQLGAFPLPQDFFALLLTGRYTLAECYWRTVPGAGWRLVLIADPLYNPFMLNPRISAYALPAELTGRPGATTATSPSTTTHNHESQNQRN